MNLSYRANSEQFVIFSVVSFLFLLVTSNGYTAEYTVSSAADFAGLSLSPGDTIVMTDGTWTNQDILFDGIGTSANPITLRPQTPGGVTLNGSSKLRIAGDWLVADGLNFEGGALSQGEHIVQFRNGSQHASNSRFTNSAIINYNPSHVDTRYFWVSMYGDSNRVDNNYFSGQNHSGVTVTVWRDNSDADNHLIDNNYFSRPKPINPASSNGFESIRIGTSTESLSSSFTTVENNLFEQADGEIEIISNKSSDNTFRYNTFRESKGALTLRHGNDNLVEGNFFLGEGVSSTGGVRVIGERQTVINNYFNGLDGRGGGNIALYSGINNSPLNGYYQVKDALIAHNTIVDVDGAAIRFDAGHGSGNRTLRPEDVTIANNIIDSFQDPAFQGTQGSGWDWAGNIVNSGSLGGGLTSSSPGIWEVDPQLSIDSNNIYRIHNSSSPAIDAAASYNGLSALTDMDGQSRSGIDDVGADEFSSAVIVRTPLESHDVGPAWMRSTNHLCGSDSCLIQAENYHEILDPDNDSAIWTVEPADNAWGGKVLKATNGDSINLTNEDHDTIAVYELEFDTAGTYTFYHRARGFNSGSNSFFNSDDFDIDPDRAETVSSNGLFDWRKESSFQFTVTQSLVGQPLEFRLGMREKDAELDALVFHLNSSLTDSELDALFLPFGANGPQTFIQSVPEPNTMLVLMSGIGALLGFSRRC